MVEYRHNKEWNTIFFEDTEPKNLKENIEEYTNEYNLGDIEVIDVKIVSHKLYDDETWITYNILVFYSKITKDNSECTS